MSATTTQPVKAPPSGEETWQLQLFRRSLKKQQKLHALLDVIGPGHGKVCLLITCGDNNGALNWHFRAKGGRWTWADAENESVAQIGQVTGDPVTKFDKESPFLPFPDHSFDIVITIDVHEHLKSPDLINSELARIVKRGGKVVVTTPSGDQARLANRLKNWVGMRKEAYGHVVDGYDVPDLEQQLEAVALRPQASSSYSGFFTEVAELAINFAFVKVMARRGKVKVQTGQIAPQSGEQMKSVGKSYRIYSWLYPLILGMTSLDRWLPSRRGYAVIVVATKE